MQHCVTTVLTSPMPSCPKTFIIDETIASVRERMPDEKILVLVDGFREGQGCSEEDYAEYRKRVTEKYNSTIVFDSWQHQSGMMRKALGVVDTPFLLFMENDVPLTGEIPVGKLLKILERDDVNSVRMFHYERVHPDHQYMFGNPRDVDGVPMMPTYQFSARPHFAKVEYYRKIMREYFKPNDHEFIEEVMHPICRNDNWTNWHKLWVYAPGTNFIRSLHSDGRHSNG